MRVVYLAGTCQGKTIVDDWENMAKAATVIIGLRKHGYVAIRPYIDRRFFAIVTEEEDESLVDGDLDVLMRCDAVVLLPDWFHSRVVVKEIECALKYNIPIYEWPDMKPLEEWYLRGSIGEIEFQEYYNKRKEADFN